MFTYKLYLSVFAAAFLLSSTASVEAQSQKTTRCDQLAAHPHDKRAPKPGVYTKDIEGEAALRACQQAMELYPDVERYRFQHARALYRLKRYEDVKPVFESLYENGYALAGLGLAEMYSRGYGVELDQTVALKYARDVEAEVGPFATFFTALVRLRMGRSAADFQKALGVVRAQAENGLAEAQLVMGITYYEGRGLPKDEEEGLRWAKRAAEQGVPAAKVYWSGLALQSGRAGADRQTAIGWLTDLSDKGYGQAISRLAQAYTDGTGVPKDLQKSFELCQRAADKNDPGGLFLLGLHYLNGWVVPQNYAAAAKNFGIATRQDQLAAFNALAYLYENGFGVERDRDEAVSLYRYAAERGFKPAQQALERLGEG